MSDRPQRLACETCTAELFQDEVFYVDDRVVCRACYRVKMALDELGERRRAAHDWWSGLVWARSGRPISEEDR